MLLIYSKYSFTVFLRMIRSDLFRTFKEDEANDGVLRVILFSKPLVKALSKHILIGQLM